MLNKFHRFKMYTYLNNVYMSLFWGFMCMMFMLLFGPKLLFILGEMIGGGWAAYWGIKMAEENSSYKNAKKHEAVK